jgi:ribosomal protein S12 methylthiotransferase accessory factor
MTQDTERDLEHLLGSLKPHFEVQELELPESPVFIAVAIPAAPETTGLRPRLPAGRGLSATQAMISAAAESIELLASLAQTCDRERNTFTVKEGSAQVLMHELGSGTTAFHPAQRVYLDWASVFNEPLLHDADSNGCASGSTWEDALNRAMLECIERDAMAIWWYGRQCRRHYSSSCLDRKALRLSWWLAERDRPFHLIDVTSDVGVPVVAAVSHDKNGRHVAIGSAAAMDSESAAVSAVTEMVQMEVSMAMSKVNEELQNWIARASAKEMQQFHPHHEAAESSLVNSDPKTQLSAAGHRVFAIDLTRRGDLLSTARAIVPTLSALHRYPDANRILTQSLMQPQFSGIRDTSETELLEPY